ncbi:hypothetical protein [Clostridium sp.]|uniref:hypothetical protein n=1 Tax=Clostridium sp. TaxID=1506 RepID=UPI0029130043|nr:hypothetical protein [Clostridium sp.]MDU7362757.1 hypothetical protein [Clostridium sp.]
MNKVFINKETDMVEQILEIREGEVIPDDYFPNCYAIDDPEGKINAYNLRYNKETKEFEIVEGIPPKDEVIVEEAISNEDLKKENEILQNKITAMQAALDEIILNLI